MDPNENSPSLMDCLDTGDHGLVLNLAPPEKSAPSIKGKGPFSKHIFTHIHSNSGDSVAPVVLLIQRSRYEPPHTMAPLNNVLLDAAWQNAIEFHRQGKSAKGPILLKNQVDAEDRLQPFSPLFYCRHTGKWFHPVCPQCGLALTLCRDEALLAERGLSGYADSLDRFLYCKTCAKISPESPFFVPHKRPRLPDIVQDQHDLILAYEQLIATLPEEEALPCLGCKDVEDCFGNEALAVKRIEPVAFFPFYMLMFPAPTCGATDFIRMISGAADEGVSGGGTAAGKIGENRFFYQNEPRQFLEILYLKLTFLAQVADHLMPEDHSNRIQEFDFSLDSIGVDLAAPGTGLPAFWNFNARILDTVGSFQSFPFAPAQPEAPFLHFLAAVWFQALLVNAEQTVEDVFAEIGKFAAKWNTDDEASAMNRPDPKGIFSTKQVYWEPLDQSLPQRWNEFWEQALQLGFQLTHAGLKTGADWDGRRFRKSLEALRKAIKTEMFSVPVVEAATEGRFSKPERMAAVLSRILNKWQTQAMVHTDGENTEADPDIQEDEATVMFTPPDAAGPERNIDTPQQEEEPPKETPAADWSDDIEETVVISSPAAKPPDPVYGATPDQAPENDSDWEDDIEETVVIKGGEPSPVSEDSAAFDDADQTIVISPASAPPPPPSTDPDADLAATIIQGGADTPPAPPTPPDGDLDATMVIDATQPPPTALDDDLEATIVPGSSASQTPKTSRHDVSTETPSEQSPDTSDLEATVVINAAGQPGSSVLPQENGEDEDLEATLIETPNPAGHPADQPPPMPPGPSQPPEEGGSPKSGSTADTGEPDNPDKDDDIMEQTVIIRSDIKKE